jgi:hypothetical protein
MAKLYDITGAADVEYGTSEMSDPGSPVTTSSKGSAVVTLTAANDYEIRHNCGTTSATTGFGVASNLAVEKYTVVKIKQLL